MASIQDCPSLPSCPPYAPFRCPMGNCAENQDMCSSEPRCPATKPYMCSDETCVEEIDLCPLFTPCPEGFVMCRTGECKESGLFCPLVASCPVHSVRCVDGSCRSTERLNETRLMLFGLAPEYEVCVQRKLLNTEVGIEWLCN